MKAIPVDEEVTLYPLIVDLKGNRSQIGLATSAHVAAFSQVREPAAFFIAENMSKVPAGSLF